MYMKKIAYFTIEHRSDWKHIPAGGTAPTGFVHPAELTAPSDAGFYTLYEGVYEGTNTHAGWKWVKE